MVIGAPSDENECRQMLYTAFLHEGPAAVRYPRGTGPGAKIAEEMSVLEIGKAVEVRRGTGVAILNFGTLLPEAVAAAEKLDATVVDMRWVKPMDKTKILELAQSHELLVTLEENAVAGGAGAGVHEFLAERGEPVPRLHLGLPDEFIEHGAHDEQLRWVGLDSHSIHRQIKARMETLESLPSSLIALDKHREVSR
jgi:1-deoxy-D-xylulose-5-phosphate synthase